MTFSDFRKNITFDVFVIRHKERSVFIFKSQEVPDESSETTL